MCNNTVKMQNTKIVKKVKSIVQNAYSNSYCLNCKQTSIVAIRLAFQR